MLIVNLLTVGGKMHQGYEKLICVPDPSLQMPRNLHLPPSLAWFCTSIEEVKVSYLPLQQIQTIDYMDVGSAHPYQFRSKYFMHFTGNISELPC